MNRRTVCPALRTRAAILIALLALPAGLALAAGLGPYPSLDEAYAQINALAAQRTDIVSVREIGKSVEGRPLLALHITRPGDNRPQAMVVANIHAGEVISSRVSFEVAARLIRDQGKDPWIDSLAERTDVWIIPVLNPDGYHRVISTGGKGGDIGTRKNANGVDLNRNFPLAPGAKSNHPLAGNHRPQSSYYMGEGPLSEPETRAFTALAEEQQFFVNITLHSVAGKFLYPHCYTKNPATHTNEFIEAGEAFVSRQSMYPYKVENSYGWYPTLGDMDDFLYINHGVFSFTVEHGTIGQNLPYALTHRPFMFWIMNPADADAWAHNDAEGVLAAIEKAFEITGGKPLDNSTIKPPPR